MMKQHEYRLVPADKVVVDTAHNARVNMNNIDKLAQDIKDNGLLHPPTMVEEKGGTYRVVAGFRRATAMKSFSTQIPAMITKNISKVDEYLIQFNENNNREDFTTYEKACALKRLEDEGLSRADIEARTGLHQSTLSNYLGLWHLPDEVQELVKANPDSFSIAHVRFLRSQLKYLEEPGIIRVAKEVMGKSQPELDKYREKLKKKLDDTIPDDEKAASSPLEELPEAAGDVVPVTDRTRVKLAATPATTLQEATTTSEELSQDEDTHDARRLASVIRLGIKGINEKYAKAEKGSPDYWRVLGAIEAMQWCLFDEPPFFEGIDLELMDDE